MGQTHSGVSDPMSRASWRYVLAALGCLFLAASPAQNNHQQREAVQAQGESHRRLSGAHVVKPLGDAANAVRGDKACKDGNKSSLPCDAESAQAAANQARYTFWEAVAAAVGVVIACATLVAAVWAATWAKRAATHTGSGVTEAKRAAKAAEDSLDQARKISDAELRPWIDYTLGISDVRVTEDYLSFHLEMSLRNIGRSVASHVHAHPKVMSLVLGSNDDQTIHAFFETRPAPSDDMMTIMPNGTRHVTVVADFARKKWHPLLIPGAPPTLAPILAVNCTYDWPGGQGRTARSYHIGISIEDRIMAIPLILLEGVCSGPDLVVGEESLARIS